MDLATERPGSIKCGSANMDQKALQERLRQAKWFFFDLDDTLHFFRRASSAASTAALQLVHDKVAQHLPGTSLSDLQTSYAAVLKSCTQAAFVDGKTSHEYREDRFRLLIDEYGVKLSKSDMEELLHCYEGTLTANLQLKAHALTLLQSIVSHNKKIAIITEGPQDAQERTIDTLELNLFVTHLATTNKHGVAKTEGLFPRVLSALSLEAEEVVMIGDSLERDIVPATDVGINSVWLDEKGDESQGKKEGVSSIGSLLELEVLLSNAYQRT